MELHQDSKTELTTCDPEMVEMLVLAATNAMQRVAIPDVTTPSEIVTATFELLDRTLRGVRRLSPPEGREHNAAQIKKLLTDLLIDHGKVPN